MEEAQRNCWQKKLTATTKKTVKGEEQQGDL